MGKQDRKWIKRFLNGTSYEMGMGKASLKLSFVESKDAANIASRVQLYKYEFAM